MRSVPGKWYDQMSVGEAYTVYVQHLLSGDAKERQLVIRARATDYVTISRPRIVMLDDALVQLGAFIDRAVLPLVVWVTSSCERIDLVTQQVEATVEFLEESLADLQTAGSAHETAADELAQGVRNLRETLARGGEWKAWFNEVALRGAAATLFAFERFCDDQLGVPADLVIERTMTLSSSALERLREYDCSEADIRKRLDEEVIPLFEIFYLG